MGSISKYEPIIINFEIYVYESKFMQRKTFLLRKIETYIYGADVSLYSNSAPGLTFIHRKGKLSYDEKGSYFIGLLTHLT